MAVRRVLLLCSLVLSSVAPLVPAAAEQPAQRCGVHSLDVQGHRGCRGLRPENTLPAFRQALELGVTTLELDLQTTRDRVLVVYHDPALDPRRCVHNDGRTVGKALFADLDFRDLADIDCGSRPHPKYPDQKAVPGARIPRLEEVLDLARQAAYPVRLNVEIKVHEPNPGLPLEEVATLVVEMLREYGLVERTIVQSFNAEVLRIVGRLEPAVRRSLVVRKTSRLDRQLESADHPPILSPRYDRLRRRQVRRLQAQGVRVIPWTVNGPDHIRRMISWGVDGIISDYPDRVIQILSEDDAEPPR